VSLIARLVLAASEMSLAMTMAACGTAGNSQTVTRSQLSGNLAIPTFSFHDQLSSVAAASATNQATGALTGVAFSASSDGWAVGSYWITGQGSPAELAIDRPLERRHLELTRSRAP
jgi:hypothetical protein